MASLAQAGARRTQALAPEEPTLEALEAARAALGTPAAPKTSQMGMSFEEGSLFGWVQMPKKSQIRICCFWRVPFLDGFNRGKAKKGQIRICCFWRVSFLDGFKGEPKGQPPVWGADA